MLIPVIRGGGGRSARVAALLLLLVMLAKDVLAEGGADSNTGKRSVVE
jgi:hypothetical protein